MRMPRDLTGRDLVLSLKSLGYEVTRQTGSHIRLTTTMRGQHHVTVPDHRPLRVGTLGAILGDIATHFGMSRDELAARLFG